MFNWSKAERTKEAHARWNSLNAEQKEIWNKEAETRNSIEPQNLPDSIKKKLGDASVKRLTHEVTI